MSNLNYDFEQMLYQFVDGELPISQEPILFDELAKNENLRNEMNDLMAMKSAVKNDIEAYTPPKKVTEKLYKRIGLIPPIAVEAPTLFMLYRKYFYSAAAVVLVSILSYWGYQKSTTAKIETPVIQTQQNQLPKVTANELTTNEIQEKKTNISLKEKQTKNIHIKSTITKKETQTLENSDNNFSNDEVIVLQEPNKRILAIELYNRVSNSPILANENLISSNSINSISRDFNSPVMPKSPNNFNMDFGRIKLYDISLRGVYSAAAYPAITTTSAAEPFITNFALGLYMHQWNNFRLGVEFGQEPFGQQFKDQSQISYVNKANLLWGGIGLNSVFENPIIENSQIFSRILLGSSEIGPLGKISLGFQYQPAIVGYSFQLGVEGSLLSYQNQGTNYVSKKIGIIYGFSWIY